MSVFRESWWLLPLIVTFFTGILCPAAGTILITQRRLLQVNLISHSVLPGLAFAIALGFDPALGGVLSGLTGALIAEKLAFRNNENFEAVINTVLSGSLGLGVLLIPLLGIRVDLEGILFGDLLTANFEDLFRTLIAFFIFTTFLFYAYKKLIYIGLDPEGAIANGIQVGALRLVLGFSTTLIIVSSISTVGVIIVIGLLSAPSIFGLSNSRSLAIAMLRSAIVGVLIALLGFMSAIFFNLSPGPLIGIFCVLSLFLITKK